MAKRAPVAAVRVLALLLSVFLALPSGPAAADSVRPAQADAAEISFWQSVKDSTTSAELEAYLKAYPNGTFAALARIRLDALNKGPKSAAAAREPAGGGAASAPVHECDRLAAHPDDPDRKAEGVPFERIVAERAARACEQAVAAHPGVARFEYQLGRALQKEKRYGEALERYRKAADKDYAPAIFNLGLMYANGTGVAKDEAEAVRWFRRAADKDILFAIYNLGAAYANGRGVAKDHAEAARWYRKAADKDYAPAMFNVALMYANGIGVAKDEAEAVRWYRRAAEKDHVPAMNNLGFMYQNGRGVPKDEPRAVEWYRKAADKDVPRAMFNLGVAYANGRGVAKDRAEALRWLRKAAERGEEPAISLLRKLGEAVPAPVASKPDKAAAPSGFGGLTAGDLLKLD
jgi:TPR repeat protein